MAERVRCIAHCDADRFFFAVEALERPELAAETRPVIVGRHPREAPRGIVATANDAARRLGIRSGLSTVVALRLAPDAVFVPPRFEVYRRYSERLMAVLRSETAVLQQLSIDEAWLDFSHAGFDVGAATALRTRVRAETGLSVTVGVATSRLVSKMATEVAKGDPQRVLVVPPGEEAAFLAPLPVRALYGVGPRSAQRLAAIGVTTVGELARLPLGRLADEFGVATARMLHDHSRGIDPSDLEPEREPRSYSAEHTFPFDTRDPRVLWRELRAQAGEVAGRLASDGLVAGEVAIKLRYANWETITRQARLGVATSDPDLLARGAAALLRRHWDRRRPVRLVGLRAARLAPVGTYLQLPLPGLA